MIHVESNADIAKKQAEAGAAADAQAEAKAKAVETRLENLVWTELHAARKSRSRIRCWTCCARVAANTLARSSR